MLRYAQGEPVTLTVSIVSNIGPTTITPTGTVTLTGLGQPAPVVTLGANGQGTWTSSKLAPGQYGVTGTYSGDANYLPSGGGIGFIVAGPPKNVTVVWMPPVQVQYGSGMAQSLCAGVTDAVGNPVPGLTVNFSSTGFSFSPVSPVSDGSGYGCTTATATKAGNLTATASVSGLTSKATFQITITPAPLTIRLEPASFTRPYGGANPTFSSQIAGLVNSDSVTVTPSTTATPSSPVGSYPVTATISGPAAANYTITLTDAVLKVERAVLSVAPSPPTRNSIYGETIPTLTGYAITGFVNGETQAVVSGAPVLSTTATSTSPAGYYPIAIAPGTLAAANYQFVLKPGRLAIGKAVLTATMNSATVEVGAPLPAFSYTLTGFVNGDTAAVLTGAPILGTTAPSTAKPGRFYITGQNGTLTSENYNLHWVNGLLTIMR